MRVRSSVMLPRVIDDYHDTGGPDCNTCPSRDGAYRVPTGTGRDVMSTRPHGASTGTGLVGLPSSKTMHYPVRLEEAP